MPPRLAKFLATFFYVGDIPVAAGSIATLLAAFLYLSFYNNPAVYISLFVLITAFGFLSGGIVERELKVKDPRCVVIDEVAGGLIAFWMLPLDFSVLITAFFLFRAFDMFKIYPAYKLEKVPGSVGIMMDDLIAGVYTNLVMHLVLRLI